MDASDPRAEHCSGDDLVLHALGEPMSGPDAAAHLSACAACGSRADQLRAVVTTGRTVTADDRLVTPPPTLWESVAREVREDGVPANVTPLRRARPSRRMLASVAAAAAAVLVVGVAVTTPWQGAGSGSGSAVAIALAPVGSSTAHGQAKMTTSADGASMTISVADLPATKDGFYEVWLMGGPDHLISLGVLDSRHNGTFPVPNDVDVASYPFVDVSLEPLDGNPAHSSDSVVRGTLPA